MRAPDGRHGPGGPHAVHCPRGCCAMGMDLRAIPDPTRTRRPAVQLYHPPSQPPSRPDTSIGFARVTVGGGEDRHATPAPSVGRTASAWPRGGRMAPQVDRFCQLCQLGYITWVGGSRSLLEKQAILAYKLKHGRTGQAEAINGLRPRPQGRGPIDARTANEDSSGAYDPSTARPWPH